MVGILIYCVGDADGEAVGDGVAGAASADGLLTVSTVVRKTFCPSILTAVRAGSIKKVTSALFTERTLPSYIDVPETETAALANSVLEIGTPVPVRYESKSEVESLIFETGATDGNETCKTLASGIEPIEISCDEPSIKRTRNFLPAQFAKSRLETVTARTRKKPADGSFSTGAPCHSSPSAI